MAMYRGGLNADLHTDAQSFTSSLGDDKEMFYYDVLATQAHVLMLHGCNIIPKEDAKNILAALRDLRMGNVDGSVLTDSEFEDCHEALEMMISRMAGEASGGHLQTARSRNDQVAVAIRLKLRSDIFKIQDNIINLITQLLAMATEHVDTIMPLYTHLQHAQVGVFSHYLLAQAAILTRDYERFAGVYGRLDLNPLGAGPVGGSSIPVDRAHTSALLGFSGMVINSLDATSSRDHMSEFMACVSILCVNLSRMAEDLVLWSSSEFGFVDISDPFASPSSAMPQKKNPDVLELVRGKAGATIGDLVSVLAIQKGLASGYGRDLQETKGPAWRASDVAVGSLRIAHMVLSELTVHRDRMAQAAGYGNPIALDVAEELVQQNVPFRVAHGEVGRLVAAARRAGKEMSELTIKEITDTSTLDYDMIKSALSTCTIKESANRRTSRGGTARSEQIYMLDEIRRKVDGFKNDLKQQGDREIQAVRTLDSQIAELLDG